MAEAGPLQDYPLVSLVDIVIEDIWRRAWSILDQSASLFHLGLQLQSSLAATAVGLEGLYLSAEIVHLSQWRLIYALEGVPAGGMHLSDPGAPMNGAEVIAG